VKLISVRGKEPQRVIKVFMTEEFEATVAKSLTTKGRHSYLWLHPLFETHLLIAKTEDRECLGDVHCADIGCELV